MNVQNMSAKAEIYEALCCLRLGALQVVCSLRLLEGAGFDLTFANGYKLLATELNAEVNRVAKELAYEIDEENFQRVRGKRAAFVQ